MWPGGGGGRSGGVETSGKTNIAESLTASAVVWAGMRCREDRLHSTV